MLPFSGLIASISALTPQPAGASTTWDSGAKGSRITLSNSNLDAAGSTGGFGSVRATTGKTTGKKYFEVKVITLNAVGEIFVGVMDNTTGSASLDTYNAANSAHARDDTFSGFTGFTRVPTDSIGSTVANKVIGVAVDLDNKKGWFANDNTWRSSGDPAGGTSEFFNWSGSYTIFPSCSVMDSGTKVRLVTSSTTYSPPSGFSTWD